MVINKETKEMGTHKQLEVWKNSIGLVKAVYQQTSGFPKEELFCLTNQIRRAAISVPANISEGSARMYSREFIYYLRISFGSLSELETLLIIASELGYMEKKNYEGLHNQIKLITVQLSRLISAIGKKIGNASHH
jgi:four helix bundle protein